jgi:PAS domain S-box-containing protein
VAARGGPVAVTPPFEDERFVALGGALVVPMRDSRGELLGAVAVDRPASGLPPGEDELAVLLAIADHAAIAVQAAREAAVLHATIEQHRQLIDASPAAIFDLEPDGRIRSWNRAAERIFGWTAAEAVGAYGPWVPPERLDEFEELRGRALAGETLYGVEVERQRKDGTRVWVSVSSAPVRDETGAVAAVLSVAQDVTERHRAEQALKASEARTAAVLQAALDAVITLDHEGRVVEFNPSAEETFGWTSGEVVGRDFVELAIPGRLRAEVAETVRAGIGPLLGSRIEIDALRSDGREFAAEISLSRVALDGPPLYAVCLRDVTRRNRRVGELREAAAKYRTLVEGLPLATYVNDLGLPIVTRWVSPQIEAMLGYPPGDWLEPDFFAARIHPDDRARVLAEVERTHVTGEPFRAEYRLLHRDGRAVAVRDETLAVRDEEYRPLFLQGFLIDVG